MPSDVTAVVLTMGEPTTGEALAAVARQTVAPAEVVVEGVTLFSSAIRAGMASQVGIACGALRDPLLA